MQLIILKNFIFVSGLSSQTKLQVYITYSLQVCLTYKNAYQKSWIWGSYNLKLLGNNLKV